jgi:mevalonate kinase
MINERYFHGKILLFGEYSILTGSDAAVVPYRKVRSRLGFLKECKQPDMMLQSFIEFLAKDNICHEFVDILKFEHDIHEGISIDSNIPMKKGLGSSGAICACIYYNYRRHETTDTAVLRDLFSHMESWFHGKSSGIDPLCIYYDKPLLKRKNEHLILSDERLIKMNKYKPFLIDTGKESETKPLVDHFSEQLEKTEFAVDFMKNYVPLVNSAVDQWTNGKLTDHVIFSLSDAQLRFFERMIPNDYSHVWKKGIQESDYAMKICGSGGGGMLLGFTADLDKTRWLMKEKYGINAIPA